MSKSAGINLNNYMRGERGQRNSSFGLICNIAFGLDIVPSEVFNEDYQRILCQHEEKRQIELLLDSD